MDDVVAKGRLAHEDRRSAHAEAKRALAEDALLQHGEAGDTQRLLELAAVLGHDMGKALDAVGLVGLVLDQETRPRLLEREPRRGAHQHVLAELAVQFRDRAEGIELQRLAESRGAAHERAEGRGARQVVVDPPAPFPDSLGARQVGIGGHRADIGSSGQVRHVQPAAHEPFVEEAGAARVLPERFRPAPLFEWLRPAGREQSREEFEVDLLVLQAELEVSGKTVGWPVDARVLVQDALGRLSHRAGGADGGLHAQGLHQGDAELGLQGLEADLHVTEIPLSEPKSDDDRPRGAKNSSANCCTNPLRSEEK